MSYVELTRRTQRQNIVKDTKKKLFEAKCKNLQVTASYNLDRVLSEEELKQFTDHELIALANMGRRRLCEETLFKVIHDPISLMSCRSVSRVNLVKRYPGLLPKVLEKSSLEDAGRLLSSGIITFAEFLHWLKNSVGSPYLALSSLHISSFVATLFESRSAKTDSSRKLLFVGLYSLPLGKSDRTEILERFMQQTYYVNIDNTWLPVETRQMRPQNLINAWFRGELCMFKSNATNTDQVGTPSPGLVIPLEHIPCTALTVPEKETVCFK